MRLSRFDFKITLLLTVIVYSSLRFSVYAQDLEPRAYSNLPVGLNFLLTGYTFSNGSVLFDPAVPLENANINIHGSLFAYARSISLGKMSGKVDMILPYVWLSGTADFQGEPVSRTVSGLGDPRVRMTLNLLGAPALSANEFKNYKQNMIIGVSLQMFMPLGQYDPEMLVNIGTNRFTFKPELGISKTIKSLFLELAVGAAFYTVNHDFYQGKTRSQAPIGSIQGHGIYNFKGGMWLAVDGTYYWGGRTTLEGVEGNDLQKNTRLGLTYAMPVNKHHSLKLNLSTGVSTRTGSDFNVAALVWQYRWGRDFGKKN